MQARSFVVTTRTLDEIAGTVLAEPRLKGDPTVRSRGLSELEAISTVGTLLTAGSPLPVPDEPSDFRNDDTVASLIETLYDQRVLTTGDADKARLDAVESVERVERVEESLLIPLSNDGRDVHNWRPVFRLLLEKLDQIADQCRRIVARFESEGTASAVTHRLWESCETMLKEICSVIRLQLLRQERLFHTYGRSPNDAGKFSQWTLEQLTDRQTES